MTTKTARRKRQRRRTLSAATHVVEPPKVEPVEPVRPVAMAEEKKLVLVSRRGRRLDESHCCAECGHAEKPLWVYKESNLGEALVCRFCKPKVFDRSFGRIDALDGRGRLPGSYGSRK